MTAPVDLAPADMATTRKPDLLGLHLVRGLCAVTIMLYHYLHIAEVGTFYAAGTYGVYIFFVLSGFALTYVYGDDEINERNLRRFFLARAFRIIPLYAAISLYQLWRSGFSVSKLGEFVVNATLQFGLATPGTTSITPGGWTIGIEAVFYLSFPLLMLLRSWKSVAVAFVVAALVNHFYVAATYAGGLAARNWDFFNQAPTFYVFFIGGMLMAKIYPAVVGRLRGARAWAFTGTIVTLSLMLALFAGPHLLGISRQAILDGPIAKIMILGSIAVVAASATVTLTGPIAVIAKFLGNISYSTYLLHLLVWGYVAAWPGASIGIKAIFAILITISLSALIYRFYEAPMRSLQRHFRGTGARRLEELGAPP